MHASMIMKHVRNLILVCAALLGSFLHLAQAAPPVLEATLLRSTTGRGFDSSGLATLSVPLPKGAIYDVVRQENGGVVLKVDGKEVLIPSAAAVVAAKPRLTPAARGFVPGKIVLISAKYSIEGNQPRNVKNNLQKLIPQTLITAPVEIFVTDALSSAAEDGVQTQISISGGSINIFSRSSTKNVLTVQYMFNGRNLVKQVPEGSKLVLP